MRLLAEEARKGLLGVSGGSRECNFGTGVLNGKVYLRTEPVEVLFGELRDVSWAGRDSKSNSAK